MTAIEVGARVGVIVAPPGFGKSTCAAEVVTVFRAAGKATAWLALDADDNDAVRFLVHLIAAVEQAIPGAGQAALTHLNALVAEGGATVPPGPVLAHLANGLSQAARPALLLVLDDYHLLTQPQLHHALAAWVELLPPGVVILLCTRTAPPLPLARWRVRRQLFEVRVADLQFTEDETVAFFRQVTPLHLSTAATAAALKRTEGWVAGLQLVAIALETEEITHPDDADVAAWLATLGGDDRYIADYLVEEVLARQSQPLQQFLLHTSVVERLQGSLCDALLALSPGIGQAMLEEAERANLFLVPLDQRRQWYRYHHLFRDLLRRQLARQAPEMIPLLHQRAAQWYAAQGLLDEGIEECIHGDVWELAVELITTLFPTVLRQGRWTTMRRWLAALPPTHLAASPQLCTWYAQMLIYTGEPRYARELLASAEGTWRAIHYVPGLIELLMVRISLARLQDDPAQVRALAAEIYAFAAPIPPAIARTVASNVAIAAQQAHEGEQAIAAIVAQLETPEIKESLILNLLLRSHLGDAYAELGEKEQANAAYQRIFEMAEGRNLFPVLRAHMGMAGLLVEGKQWEEASHHAQEAIRLAQSSERTLYTAPALLVLAQVATARGELTDATHFAQQSLEFARTLGNARQEAAANAWLAQKILVQANANASPKGALVQESILVEPLTARELDVLRLLDAGASNQQIAEQLVISLNTVKKHIANLLGKLHAESRTHALARARAVGLI